MDSDSDHDNDLLDSDSDDSSQAAEVVEERWRNNLPRIRENDPLTTKLVAWGGGVINNMTDEDWEQLGRDISNNTHLTKVDLSYGCLNDHRMSFLFRGLTKSSSISYMALHQNADDSIVGVRSMVPFLQNATNLHKLTLSNSDIQSGGFNVLFQALRDSPIKTLKCNTCGIESISINSEHIPGNLKNLSLSDNNIDADGCRELVKLLQGGDATLESLFLQRSKIDDEGVAILVDALRSNTSLKELHLDENAGISNQGKIKLLKLVNDVSSIKATLQSNHTLINISAGHVYGQIQTLINIATNISDEGSPETAGREKVIKIQLDSEIRAELAELQGVNQSLYSEIDPLHLTEVLALVCRHHGQQEFFIALKSSIAGVISTVDRKECIRQQMAYHEEKLKELSTELATIEAAEGVQGDGGGRSKRHRAC